MRLNNKGFSLLTTLILSAVALAFISALWLLFPQADRSIAKVRYFYAV